MKEFRICVDLKWMSSVNLDDDEVVLHARWMRFYVDASGGMCPGEVSGWEPVGGDVKAIQGVL